jgi:hypothetical protein
VNEIHDLLDVPSGTIQNSAIFSDYILPDSVENFCAQGRKRTITRIMVHLANAHRDSSSQSCECFKVFRFYGVLYPAYSPDLASVTSSSLSS